MRTLRRAARVRGRGLFSDRPVALRFLPASGGWRWGIRPDRLHLLRPEHLAPLPHRSRLMAGADVAVLPEHALAALVLLDVDAVDIVFEGGEAPVGDGSGWAFVRALRSAGLTDRGRSCLRVSTGEVAWTGGLALGRARTFLQREDATRLRPLFPGSRPGGAVLLDGDSALYGGRPRCPAEPASHKLLDLLGDLGPWRAAGPLRGHLHVAEPRHIDNPVAIVRAFAQGDIQRA